MKRTITIREIVEQIERDAQIAAGAESVSWHEYQRRAMELGYRIVANEPCPGVSLDCKSGRRYQESTYSAIEIRSGLGFAHVGAPRDRLPAFQQFRLNHVCLHRGRIRSV
jgi:hypothetical protein